MAIDKFRPESCCVLGQCGSSGGCGCGCGGCGGGGDGGRGGWLTRLPPHTRVRPPARPAGNYYSLRGEHEKSVVCFKRALSLDRSYVSAWTLMGHEYVELKNHERAIQAYRQAVSVNPRDYRAWCVQGAAGGAAAAARRSRPRGAGTGSGKCTSC